AALRGEPEPRTRPAADRPLAHFQVAGLFEHARLLRQHRVADPGRIPQGRELDPVRPDREQPADRQPRDRMDQRIARCGHATPPPADRCWRPPRTAARAPITPGAPPRTATTIATTRKPCSSRKCSATMTAALTTSSVTRAGRPGR